MPPPPPVLMDELVEEVLLRLPPDEPALLVRSSAVCRPWRCILAAPRFRRRYREFHGTPPILGIFEDNGTFFPTSGFLPSQSQPHRPNWVSMDCRHGRALFLITDWENEIYDLVVLDPVTGNQRHVPSPYHHLACFSAAVLCAAQDCDHHDCQGGHFLVAVVTTHELQGITSGWLYSSENHVWSELASVHHPNFHHPSVSCTAHIAQRSVLVADALYFNVNGIIKCQVGTLSFSLFEKPIDCNGTLMTAEGGGLGFAALVDATNIALWSSEIGPDGSMEWAKIRVIDIKTLHSDLFPISNEIIALGISGSAEGTQIIFVRTSLHSYMVDLKSCRARRVSAYGIQLFPYMRFYFPAMEAACTGQGQ